MAGDAQETVIPPRRPAFGRRYTVIGISWTDPRLALTVTISALQVLGQVVLGFDVSVAQILIAIGVAAVLDGVLVAWTRRQISWPASAIQTGNGIGLILRVPGTEHGDWWSTRGWSLFAGVAAISILSKYAVRWADRHLFNPSNFGLVLAFVSLGTAWADPQDLWWGPLSGPVVAALLVIAFGAVTATYRAGVLRVAVSFYFPFAILLAVLAGSGHWMTARWSVEPITGWQYWWVVVTSPEILVFTLFMITDPRTVPKGETARTAFGMAIATAAVVMLAPVHTEFWTKVNLLAALVLCCAVRPVLESVIPASTPLPRAMAKQWAGSPRALIVTSALMLVLVATIVGLGTPARRVPAGSPAVTIEIIDGERPAVAVPAGVALTLDESIDVAGTVSPTMARRAASDVLTNLSLEAEALRTSNLDLAELAAYGPRLEQLRRMIQTQGPVEVTTLTPTHLSVQWTRASSGAQAPPQLAVTAWGIVTRQVFHQGEPLSPPEVADSSRTYLLIDAGGMFLTVDETEPIGTMDGPEL